MITALGSVKNSRLKLPRPTPDARGTGTAEGRAQVPDEETVHPDRTDVESGRHTMGTVEVLSEQQASKPYGVPLAS